jgi:hypothetical protein
VLVVLGEADLVGRLGAQQADMEGVEHDLGVGRRSGVSDGSATQVRNS